MALHLEHWSGKAVFIIAAIGSAVGIGNIWRFPYIMGQNGGLAFLVPYFLCVLLFGIPLLALEISAGMHFRTSYLGVMKKISFPKIPKYVPLAIIFFISSYYLVITSWMLFYSFGFFSGMEVSFAIISGSYLPALFFALTFFALYSVMSLGIHKGIEPVARLFLPLLFLFLLGIAIYVLSMPGALETTFQKLSFDSSYIYSPKTWLYAISQAIFSLSVGMGLMMTYAAYVDRKQDIKFASFAIAGGDTLASLISIFIVFPLVFLSGGSISGGTLLSLDALPAVFLQMPFGNLVGGLFFLSIFIAAFTSAISMAEFLILSLETELRFSRPKAVEYCLLALMAVSFLVLLSYSPLNLSLAGMPLLDLFDLFFGTMLAPLSALAICISLAYFWKDGIYMQLIDLKDRNLESLVLFLLKLGIPATLILLFLYGVLG